jgi:hypothetical protein
MASKAKDYRDECEVKLLGVYQDLMQVVEEQPGKKRAVSKEMDKLEKAWEKLQKGHSDYCKHAKMSLTSTESLDFLKEKGKFRRDGINAAKAVLGDDDEAEEKQVIQGLESELFKLQLSIEGDLSALASLAAGGLTTEQHEQTREILGEVEGSLNRYMECSNTLVQGMESEAGKKKLEESEKFYKPHYLKYKEYRGTIVKKTPVKAEPVQPGAVRESAQPDSHRSSAGGKQPVKIKAMDCPKWDGRYRTFPRFKKLWDENISPRHEDSALHYMLCESLPRKVLDNISTLSNSAEDIWAYLDEKYGRPEIVAREVMAELMGLDSKKLGQQFMGKFCTMLMDTHSLLVTLNEVEWLVTNKTVAEMEDKLPREERLEWAKQMSGIGGETRFEKFRNFLQSRKVVLENVEMMGCRSVGSEGGTKCEYCGRPGHTVDRCYTKQREQGGQSRDAPYGQSGGKGFAGNRGGCAICQSEDHWKNECPEKGGDRDRRAVKRGGSNSTRGRQGGQGGHGGQGGGQGGGGGNVTAEVGSNTLRTLECPRCKASSKQTYCAGCKKTANVTHCLLHCESFMVLSVKERADVVKTSKSCPICLHSSHTADRCYNKDKDNYICGVNGCQSHHHPCLHGSKDIYVTGVNVLLRQQTQAVTTACQDAFLPVGNWMEREQYMYDSWVGDSVTGQGEGQIFCQAAGTDPEAKRKRELEEVKAELAKPLLNGDKVLMTVIKVEVTYGMKGDITKVVCFFDDGSNCSVIKNSLAVKLGLWGDPVTLELGTVNATTTLETKLYCLELLDSEGGRHLVKAFGLDSISGELPSIKLDGIKEVQRNWGKMARPDGDIEVLIGSEVAHLHPVHSETVGNMVIKKSIFGTGWVLNGGHDKIVCGPVEFDGNVQVIRSGFYRSNKISITYTQEVNINTVEEYKFGMTEKEFMRAESLGCEPPRRCQDCWGCKQCGFRGSHMSQREAVELRMMEDGVSFDESIGKWRVKYPFIQDPRILSNNYRRVLRMMESLERRLAKIGETEAANEVFQKMVTIGALKEVSAEELKMMDDGVSFYESIGKWRVKYPFIQDPRILTNN